MLAKVLVDLTNTSKYYKYKGYICPRGYTDGKWRRNKCADCGLIIIPVEECWEDYAHFPDRDWTLRLGLSDFDGGSNDNSP